MEERQQTKEEHSAPLHSGRGRGWVSLFELNNLVKEVVECEMPNEYWVEAELSECRELRGHCYLELIQKDERSATPIAKAPARCWASKWTMIRPYFERTTGQQLHAGMKVLLKVYAQFHEAYGFAWIVTDIDPTYTLGDMARKRQEIIRQLKEEGVFDLQKELSQSDYDEPDSAPSAAFAAQRRQARPGLNCNGRGRPGSESGLLRPRPAAGSPHRRQHPRRGRGLRRAGADAEGHHQGRLHPPAQGR